ncbi:MAG: acyclic terpene utilization AtuA family protein [Ruegeria sp.]
MTSALRIGGACGFWGEATHATAQLLGAGVDVLVYDYLAEITMSIMARARMKDASLGYAPDFVTEAMGRNLAAIAEGGVKVLSNAGGVNPLACAEALRARIAEAGLDLKVAVVEGDDLLPRAAEFAGEVEMFSGAPMPPVERIASINVYIGAAPIVVALQAGADIVITGRCVDSALTLAACMHHFGWGAGDFDLLAAGSLAGHLLECGPQSTGGNFTDWEQAGDPSRIGYPIAEVSGDGAMVLTKPEGTTGVVSPASVGEQMLYEIGDPQAYHLPDVICDFSGVEMAQNGPDRVRVTGARGRAPSGRLKVSVTWTDGYRAGMVFQMNGRDARTKARAFAQAGLDRARGVLAAMGAPDYREVSFEAFGGRPGDGGYEEIAFKAAVRHDDARAVGVFLKELTGGALATPPGLHFFTGGGRPKPSPVVALFSFLVDVGAIECRVTVDGEPVAFDPPGPPPMADEPSRPEVPPTPGSAAKTETRRLEALAWARSGDKGDSANIGVIARHPTYMPHIWAALTPEAVARMFSEELQGQVERFYLPGLPAMNILMTRVLGGGGVASLRNDAQGKAFAQKLLSLPVEVPAGLIVNS